MIQILKITFYCSLSFLSCSCILAAAGAGAEAGYIASQNDRTTGEVIDDQRITSSVKALFLTDSEVSGLNINVDTFKRRVTLKGVVDTSFEAQKAQDIASQVSGVRSVDSQLYINEFNSVSLPGQSKQ